MYWAAHCVSRESLKVTSVTCCPLVTLLKQPSWELGAWKGELLGSSRQSHSRSETPSSQSPLGDHSVNWSLRPPSAVLLCHQRRSLVWGDETRDTRTGREPRAALGGE